MQKNWGHDISGLKNNPLQHDGNNFRTLCFKRGFRRVLFVYITLTTVGEIDYNRIQTVCDIVWNWCPHNFCYLSLLLTSYYFLFRLRCKALAWGTHVGFRDRSFRQLDIQIVLRQFTFANHRLFYYVKLQVFHLIGCLCSRHFMVCTCMTHNSHLLRINNAKQLTLILRELLFAANQNTSNISRIRLTVAWERAQE